MALGLTQGQLGEAAGLSHQQIGKYEAGTNRVHPSDVMIFAKALDAPVSYFFEAHLDAFSEEPEFLQYLKSDQCIELNTAFARVTDQAKRRVILNIVDSFKELSMQRGGSGNLHS